MSLEDQQTDRKSLRAVTGRTADWDDFARACVCFANGSGGCLLIGVEDGETLPPAGQVMPPDLLDRLRKRIGELTVNVQALPSVRRASNGGEFEPHRLLELVREDLRRYPRSKIGEISGRIGAEISRSQLKRALADLVRSGVVAMEGRRNGARYRLGDAP